MLTDRDLEMLRTERRRDYLAEDARDRTAALATAIAAADVQTGSAGLPTYTQLLAALRRVDAEKGHTMHKPAGVKAYSAAVLPRQVTDDIQALLALCPA